LEGTGTFTSLIIDKKSKRSHKIVGIKGFLTFLLDDRGMDPILIRILPTNGSGFGALLRVNQRLPLVPAGLRSWSIRISVFWDGTKIMFDSNIKKIQKLSAFGS
jgi:hypothetical protein